MAPAVARKTRRDAIKRWRPRARPTLPATGPSPKPASTGSKWVLRPTLSLGLRALHRNYLQEAAPRPPGGAAVSALPVTFSRLSVARFPGLPANCGKHRRSRVSWLAEVWRAFVLRPLARWWRPPNNERHAKEADQETRDEARYEPEQAGQWGLSSTMWASPVAKGRFRPGSRLALGQQPWRRQRLRWRTIPQCRPDAWGASPKSTTCQRCLLEPSRTDTSRTSESDVQFRTLRGLFGTRPFPRPALGHGW